jgi:hypothetical protein
MMVCSFHIPPGSSWGSKLKGETQEKIAEWLARQSGSLIFGIDANSPKTDHFNHEKNEWWNNKEPLLLGAEPLHKCRDAFRIWLSSRTTDELGPRSSTPLATSYYRGHGAHRTPCRYDFVFLSDDINTENIEYIFDQRLSDHALVAGSFKLGPSRVGKSRKGRR